MVTLVWYEKEGSRAGGGIAQWGVWLRADDRKQFMGGPSGIRNRSVAKGGAAFSGAANHTQGGDPPGNGHQNVTSSSNGRSVFSREQPNRNPSQKERDFNSQDSGDNGPNTKPSTLNADPEVHNVRLPESKTRGVNKGNPTVFKANPEKKDDKGATCPSVCVPPTVAFSEPKMGLSSFRLGRQAFSQEKSTSAQCSSSPPSGTSDGKPRSGGPAHPGPVLNSSVSRNSVSAPNFVAGSFTPTLSQVLRRKHSSVKSWKQRARAAPRALSEPTSIGVSTGKRHFIGQQGPEGTEDGTKKGKFEGLAESFYSPHKAAAGVQPRQVQ
ncbi:hypothetical protein SLA2020_421370 [Shorea laevis]